MPNKNGTLHLRSPRRFSGRSRFAVFVKMPRLTEPPRHATCSIASPGVMSPLSGSKGPAFVPFALVFGLGAGFLFAQDQSAATISHQVRELFERAAKAVVKIHGVDEHSEICGTGFFVDPTGTLYTAYTVGGEAGNFTVEFNGKKYPARQLVADIRSGTAILKVDETTPGLPIGKSEELELATPVVSIGYPLDLPKTADFGMIAGF